MYLTTMLKTYHFVSISGERYGSRSASRQWTYGRIRGSWCGHNGIVASAANRRSVVRHYIAHTMQIDGTPLPHVSALDWLKKSDSYFGYENPLSVWYTKQYETAGPAVFIPVQKIYSHFSIFLTSI